MRFSIATLGCKVNQYESQRMRETLLAAGFQEVDSGSPAELNIINTCTVTHQSDAQNRKFIRKVLGQGRVLVTGCQAVTDPDAIRALSPGIEVVAPQNLEHVLSGDLPRCISAFQGHARAFVKVQEGCDNHCSFCIVPSARGNPVSRPLTDIVEEIGSLSRAGYREVVLTGTNIGLYQGGLSGLLRQILNLTDVTRIRISSIEPWTIQEDLLDLFASPRLCRHMHLPLQSGCARILEAMGRPYRPDYYQALVQGLKARFPDMAIGADVMAGFAGEDEAAFAESLAFIEEIPLDYVHAFPYSRRRGTQAAALPGQVNEDIKRKRVKMLRALSERKRALFMASQQGSVRSVVINQCGISWSSGLTDNYITVRIPGQAHYGQLLAVQIGEADQSGVRGSLHG